MSAYFCGLDVHKESTYATVLGPDGGVVAQSRMPNEDVPGFLEPMKVERVAMEASTSIAPLYRKLVDEGYDVLVSHPKKTRYIAEARIKSDRVDSKALAELLRLDSLPESYMPPPEVAMLREKVRRRAFLVRERAKLKTKIRSTLTYEGVKPPTGHGLFTRKGKEWLEELGLEPVNCYLRVMEVLKQEINLLNRDLRGVAGGDGDVQLLMTVPGIGYYIALLVKAEVGDVIRFTSGDHLSSYAGLVPSTHSSGGVSRHGKITKEGSRWLRWAIVEAVHVHLRYDTPVTRFYHRVAERRGSKTAKVAAARKLLTVCYSVLSNRRPYYNPLHAQAEKREVSS
jgi:transposase